MHSNYKHIAKSFHVENNLKDNSSNKYRIDNFDEKNGWAFNEIEHLSEMGFSLEDDYTFTINIDKFDFSSDDNDVDTIKIEIYKNDDGYVLSSNRKYVFNKFDEMINFIENSKIDFKFKND